MAYIGQLISTPAGGPVHFIVRRIEAAGTKYNTLAGPAISTEPVVHLAFPDDLTKEVFAASVTKLAPIA